MSGLGSTPESTKQMTPGVGGAGAYCRNSAFAAVCCTVPAGTPTSADARADSARQASSPAAKTAAVPMIRRTTM